MLCSLIGLVVFPVDVQHQSSQFALTRSERRRVRIGDLQGHQEWPMALARFHDPASNRQVSQELRLAKNSPGPGMGMHVLKMCSAGDRLAGWH